MGTKAAAFVWGLVAIVGCSAGGASQAPGLDTGSEQPDAGSDASDAGAMPGPVNDGGGITIDGSPTDPLPPPEDCSPKIIGLLRDFQSPRSSETTINDSALTACPVYGDFQAAWTVTTPGLGNPEPGIPMTTLGDDGKPVFSGGDFETITSAETFDAWYRDDPDCNQTFEYELEMVEDPASGNLVFDSPAFFPLDGRGYGTSGKDGPEGDLENYHNYHFTFELHMTFKYNPGDVFTFTGDDDLWVFINKQRVIDLGGAHAPMTASVDLDSLGLVAGTEYPIDFFHAERAESKSNFHIETSLQFTNCDPIIVR